MNDEMKYKITIVRSNRKTMALQIKEAGELIVKVPIIASDNEIKQMIASHSRWIENHMAELEQLKRTIGEKYTIEEIEAMGQKAVEIIPGKVKHYAKIIDVTYGRITIRNQHSRWGSCSSKGNLNFNCLLMQAPDEVLDYVIIHELCHRKHMNHSPEFWKLVALIDPDFKRHKEWLKHEGRILMARNI